MVCEEREVTVHAGVDLGATVARPEGDGKHPAVVIIMGTGELDRDGNGKGIRTDFYRGLAELFADAGFVSVRYDKRNTHRSGKSDGPSGLSELTDDAAAVVRYAKDLPCVDGRKVIVCGHSEGAIIATLLSLKEDTAGMILLGGAGTSLRDALYYQNRRVAEEAGTTKGLKGLLLRGASDAGKNCAAVDSMFEKCAGTDKGRIFFKGWYMCLTDLRLPMATTHATSRLSICPTNVPHCETT